MAIRKIHLKSDARKTVLKWAALAIVLSGLFPPWLYVFDKTGTSDEAGGHWEVSAGDALLFRPPNVILSTMTEKELSSFGSIYRAYHAHAGVKLDTARLAVEWVCILAVSGAAWGLVRIDRELSSLEDSAYIPSSPTSPPTGQCIAKVESPKPPAEMATPDRWPIVACLAAITIAV